MGATADQNLNLNITNNADTGSQNDYNPSGFSGMGTYRNTGGGITLTGMVAGREGRLIGMIASNGQITITGESASSTAANRFASSFNLFDVTGQARLVWYDPVSDRWRRVGRA